MPPTEAPFPFSPAHDHAGACCGGHGAAEVRAPFRARLPDGHVLATLMDEHARMLAHLDHLEPQAAKLENTSGMAFARIEAIARHLIGAEPHHQREEQVLFPALRERGIEGPPAVMEEEHVELRALKHAVVDLAGKCTAGDKAAVEALRRTVRTLVSALRSHIDKEDSILYPMAFASMSDADFAAMRARCDEVGYCCGR
jgi:hemerythrin-like domain-containing protein